MCSHYSIRKLVVFAVILSCMCYSECFEVSAKTKRKVEVVKNVSDKSILDGGSKNTSSGQTGRGFLPTGSIFTLGKVLNFFPVGGERECKTTKSNTVAKSGICLNPYDCRQRDGKAAGDCAHGLGVCCVFEVTCGGKIQNNLSHFMSPGFPDLWPADKDCKVTIEKAFAGIMQLRVDFVHFNIGQPNRTTGECDQDVMTLGVGDDQQFKLCGQNHGQHIYYTLSTASEARESDELPGSGQTQLVIKPGSGYTPRLWLMRLAQLPLADSAPHECLQYFTGDNGTITTFNYAVNGRHLARQQYKACVRKNPGMCAIRYDPCDERSFRIGPGGNSQEFVDTSVATGPGSEGGPGTGFYGPDGSFVSEPVAPSGQVGEVMDPEVVDTLNDPVDGDMMPAESEIQEDEIEGSGADPQIAPSDPVPVPTIASRIWSFIWPSWLWGQRRSGRTFQEEARRLFSDRSFQEEARRWVKVPNRKKIQNYLIEDMDYGRIWNVWSPYRKHFLSKVEDEFLYQGYGKYGDGVNGYGRLRCQDRITIPCDNEYFISNNLNAPGVCDPHHCGSSFCPGLPFTDCHVFSSVSPFSISMHFGDPKPKTNPEDNIGACLRYSQMPCES